MAKRSNPSGRIYEILRQAKRCAPETLVKDVWASVLGADSTKVHTIFARLVRLEEAFEEAQREVSSLDVNHELYLKFFPILRSAVAPTNLEQRWEKYRSLLSEEALTTLEFCSDLLDSKLPEKNVPDDELERLAAEVNQLLESVLTSDLSTTAKHIMADIARSMQDALTEYRVRGVRGMREALFEIVARLERNFSAIDPERAKPEVSRMFQLLSRWETITAAYVNTAQIAGSILPPLLQMGGLS